MEQLKALKALLCCFPQWGAQSLSVDARHSCPEGCGLFPLGLQVTSRQEDVLGNVTYRLRQSFLLRRAACAGETAAAWLMELQDWLLRQPTEKLEGCFGKNLRLRPEAGHLVNARQPGTGIYEIKIHVDYEKE